MLFNPYDATVCKAYALVWVWPLLFLKDVFFGALSSKASYHYTHLSRSVHENSTYFWITCLRGIQMWLKLLHWNWCFYTNTVLKDIWSQIYENIFILAEKLSTFSNCGLFHLHIFTLAEKLSFLQNGTLKWKVTSNWYLPLQ